MPREILSIQLLYELELCERVVLMFQVRKQEFWSNIYSLIEEKWHHVLFIILMSCIEVLPCMFSGNTQNKFINKDL